MKIVLFSVKLTLWLGGGVFIVQTDSKTVCTGLIHPPAESFKSFFKLIFIEINGNK